MEVVEVCTKTKCPPPLPYRPTTSPCTGQMEECTRRYVQPPRMPSYAPKKIHRPPSAPFDSKTTYHLSYLNNNLHYNRIKSIRPQPILKIAKEKFNAETTNHLSYQPIWEIVKTKPFIPLQRKLLAQGPMQTTTTVREDYGPKYIERSELILPSGNIKFCSGQMDDRTTSKISFVNPGYIKPPVSFKPSVKYSPSNEPTAKETTHMLSYQPFRIEQRELYPWAQKPIYKSPEDSMSGQTTYNKSYMNVGIPIKAKSILPTSNAEWFQGNREFNSKTCYSDAYFPRPTEPKCIPVIPPGNINLSNNKMASDTTNKLSYQSVSTEKRKPFCPKHRNMLGSGTMQSTTTNRLDFQFKTVDKSQIIIPCDNIKNSTKPLENSTTSALSYMNHGIIQPPSSFKPPVTYNRSTSKLDSDTINKLSYQPWTPPIKETHPWAKKSIYQRPKDQMSGDTIYHMSFPPPGYYIDECNPSNCLETKNCNPTTSNLCSINKNIDKQLIIN